MKRRSLLGAVVGASLACCSRNFAVAAPATGSLPEVRRPSSLAKVCQELTRSFQVPVTTDATLADLHVVWAFRADRPLKTTLERLAELAGGRVVWREATKGETRVELQQPLTIGWLEAAWRRRAVQAVIDEGLRAATHYEQGRLNPADFAPNLRGYLERGRAAELKYLRHLTSEGIDRLLAGENVQLPPGAVPDAELVSLVKARYSEAPGAPKLAPEAAATARKQREEWELRRTRQYGLGLRIDFRRHQSYLHLTLVMGRGGATVLTRFNEDELGMRPDRTNPYERLQTGEEKAASLTLPEQFQKRLGEDIVVSAEESWHEVVAKLARVTGLELISDAYLHRAASKLHLEPGQKRVLARRGVTVAEALDQVCQPYAYLWWEKDGVVYLRSRAWVWDQLLEEPFPR